MNWRTLTWIGGLFAGIVVLIQFGQSIATVADVQAAEKRVAQSQEQILRQLLEQQRIQTEQSKQQFYTLRIQLLESEIERLTDKLVGAEDYEIWWIQDKLNRLSSQLTTIQSKLEALMLEGPP